MQYTITINQLAVMKAGLDLDVVDMAIFDFIKHYAHTEKCMKLQTETGTFFWIAHTTIIEQLPILGISTGAGIIKRINKLIDAGILTRHPNCDLMRKTFYKFGPNYDKVCFTTNNESYEPTTNVEGTGNKSLGISPNNRCGYHNNNNQFTIEQTPADGGLFPTESGTMIVTHPRRTNEPLCLFADSKYFRYENFEQEFKAPEFVGVDILYYYHAVADWSSRNGKKQKDWIATARNFMRNDKRDGKMVMINKDNGPVLSADAIEYLKEMGD